MAADVSCEGDADGLGETRKKELVKSGLLLGLRQEDDVFVVESPYAYPAPMRSSIQLSNLVVPGSFQIA